MENPSEFESAGYLVSRHPVLKFHEFLLANYKTPLPLKFHITWMVSITETHFRDTKSIKARSNRRGVL